MEENSRESPMTFLTLHFQFCTVHVGFAFRLLCRHNGWMQGGKKEFRKILRSQVQVRHLHPGQFDHKIKTLKSFSYLDLSYFLYSVDQSICYLHKAVLPLLSLISLKVLKLDYVNVAEQWPQIVITSKTQIEFNYVSQDSLQAVGLINTFLSVKVHS